MNGAINIKHYQFSIIMPVYNVEDYLESALQSIYNQTYQDFELIAVDDGSCDNSPAILKEWNQRFGERYHIVSQTNQGLSAARNAGLKEATGHYILFFDSDDCMHPQLLESIIKYGDDVDMIRFGIATFEHGQNITMPVISKINVEKMSIDEYLLSPRFRVAAWSYAIKHSILQEFTVPFKPGLIHEDLLYTVDIIEKVKTVYYLDADLYYYRVRPKSITTSIANLGPKRESVQYLLEEMHQRYLHESDTVLKSFYEQRFYEAVGLFESYHSLSEINKMYKRYQIFTGIHRPWKLTKKALRIIKHKLCQCIKCK